MPKDKPSVGRYRFRYSVFSTLYRRARTRGLFAVFTALLTGLVIGASLGSPWVVKAQTPNSTINYQARILSASGALVPDGNYHVEFKIYNAALPDGGETPDQGACTVNTGTADEDCLWVETRTTGNLVRVVNGYVSVNLGSVTAFPTNMPWGSQLYVTMRIGGMSGPSWDTEMTNTTTGRMRITAVPYAFQAANVRSGDTNAASTNSNNIVVQTGNATGATSNSGSVTIDSGTATGVTGALLLGTTNASAITLGHSGITTTIQGSVSLTGTGTALTVTNNVQVDGNTTLGNNAGVDTLTVNAAANFTGNLSVSSGNTFTNAGSTVFTAITAGPFGADGSIGSAASTVDVATTINLSASTTGVDLTLASPTSTTAGRILYLNNTGANSLTVEGNPIASGKSASFIWNGTAWVQTISFTSTGVDTIGAIDGGTYSANGASISGTTIYLQAATSTHVGLVTTSAQNFAGVKTFDDGLVIAAGKSLTVTGGNTASRPASPTEGMVYYDNTTKQLLAYANGKWQADRTDAVLVAASNSSQADKDIADYVADGNTGASNDGDQIQINSALAAASGRKVVLLAGTYVADETVLVPNNTILTGVGLGTVIELADLDIDEKLIENSDSSTGTGVVIRDLKIDGRNDLNTAGDQYAIYLNGMGSGSSGTARQGAKVANVYVSNFNGWGISLNNSDNNGISGSTIRNSGLSIQLNNSSDNNIVSGNTIQGNGIGSAIVVQASSYNTITENVVQENYYGVTLFLALNNTIVGNVINDSTAEGMYIYDSNLNTIAANTVQGSGLAGIYIQDADKNIVASNTIHDNGSTTANLGIEIVSNSLNNSITGNAITDTSASVNNFAISIEAGSNNNYLADNTYSGPAGYPATINDAGTNTRYASQLTPTQVLQSGSSLIKANATNVITGSIDPTASTSVTGVGTFFTTELQVGDRITVSGETRTITAISSATALTVDTAFSDNANDTSVDRLPAALRVTDSSGANRLLVKDSGDVVVGSGTAGVSTLAVVGSSDQTQLLIKANATQSVSNPLVLLQNSSGAELARINASTSSLYFGNAAGGSSAAGANNTGIGASALGSVSTGTGNTTLGSGALASVSVGTNNTALGYNAGNLSTGSSNLFLGQGAGSNATTGSNNIIIGAGLNASAAGVSNELRIGGVLQGDTSTLAAQFNGTLAVTTLGTADTSTFLCRNTSNQLASCSSTPLTSSLTDNITNAFDLQESTNNYININTTNGSENVSFGNASTNPSYNFLGSGTLAVAGSQTIGGTLAVTGNSTLGGDLAVNGGDITTAAGDLTIAPAGNDTLITGNLDVSGTLFAGTGDAFQVSSTGAVTAVGVNSGTGLIQGTGGLTILGTTSINATGSSNTSIGATSNSGTIAIGNSASTTNILGATTINTTGTAATSIGNSGAVTTLSGSSILLNSATLQRTSAGTTSFDLVDGANTTLALQNSGAGVLNLTVDGSATVGTNLTVSGGTATLGTAAQAGSLVVSDGSSSTITIKSATQVAATNYDVTVPAITANDTFCLFTLNNCVNANAFVQNGNSFTAAATLGTNDAYTLAFETNNITRITLDTSYKAYFGNGATNATPQGFTLQGTSGSGTNITGAGLTIASGQGTGTGTSGNITFQYAPAGASGSSLNALQAACTISGTNGSLSCPGAGSDSERFGAGATAGGSQAVALGYIAQAGGVNSIAIGGQSIANVYQSNAIGWGATSPGTNSLAVGTNATSNTDSSVALGVSATSGQNGVSLGYGSVSGFNSTALGQQASANNYASIALGSRATTTADYQLVVGSENDGAYVLNGYLGAGITSANAASRDFKLQVTSGSGTNIGGADFTLAAGQGTGTGVGGAILFQTAAPGASGSSLNALTTRAEIQADGDLAVDTNTLFVDATNNRVGIVTATPSYDLSFGSGASRTIRVENQATLNTAGNNLTVQAGTGNGTGGVGGVLTLQGGSGSTTNINGGNVVIAGGASGGGTGVKGLVVIDTATYSAATVQNFTGNANITQSNIDSFGSVLISGDVAGRIATLTDPTLGASAAGRVIYVTNSGSVDITLSANTVGVALSITLKPASTATMFWNGTDWTAAGASSSTDLQAAYNNTAASAGNAEIVLSSTGTGGLTIRNDATTAITGGLLEVQTSIGSNLFTVNNNAAEYASNGGAESSTFTAWTAHGTGPSVTRYTTAGNNIATGVGSVFVDTTSTANTGAKNTLSTALTANLRYKVSYTARHTSSTGTFTTLETYFSNDGTAAAVECGSDATIYYNKWTRVDCTFTPTSVGASNAIFFRHTDAVEHDFYIDNFSVTVDASSNHAVDGQVDAALGTNWQAYDADGGAGTSAVTRDTTNIYDTSGAVAVTTTAGSAQGEGVRNNMQTTPSVSTQYLVTFYAKSSTAFSDIKVGFLPAGGSGLPVTAQQCADYNTQTVSTTAWTKVTCIFTTPSSGISDPDVVIYQGSAAARTFYVDSLTVTLNTNNSSNVQIGGGQKGGPTTLLTLDRSYGAPIADNIDAYLGSMYYDTSTGRIQCYEADGWGACGAAPDNIVNLNPEYAGAVLNGSGVGTMTADFCADQSGVLQVNASLCDGTGSPAVKAANYYRWTSPQATSQTYSIYVTYQLPATFNGFSNDDTVKLTGRVDNITNATVSYEMYKSVGGTITACGTETTVAGAGAGSANTWYTVGVNGNESTGCSFSSSAASGFVIFKINVKANSNANAYVSTLNFVTTGR